MAGKKKTESEKEKNQKRKRENRLKTIRYKLEAGTARDLQEILDDYPPSLLAKDLAMAYATLKRRTDNPALFDIGEIKKWAALIEVKYEILRDFIDAEVKKSEK